MIKHERVRTYVLVFQFSIKISAVDLRLSLKNCCSYFRVTFSKTSSGILLRGCWSWRSCTYVYVLTCLEIIPTAADETATGRIYTSLVVWMHVQCCLQGTARTYIYVFGTQRLKQTGRVPCSPPDNKSCTFELHTLLSDGGTY